MNCSREIKPMGGMYGEMKYKWEILLPTALFVAALKPQVWRGTTLARRVCGG